MDSLAAIRLVVKSSAAKRLAGGHPWVFQADIAQSLADLPDGEEADVFDQRDQYVGRGLVSVHSPIACRIYSHDRRPLDREFFRSRLLAAQSLRTSLGLPNEQNVGYRAVYAEGDGLSGLIVDRYGDFLVLQTATAGMERRKAMLLELLDELFHPRGICERNDLPARRNEQLPSLCGWIAGEATDDVEFKENGLLYRINPLGAMKTGHFFDQRDNRQLLAGICQDRRILEMFCYTGSFGLAAARYGAKEVLSVDSSAAALEVAARNAQLNGSADRIRCQAGDGFDVLKSLNEAGESFDVVVLDPPAFTKRQTHFENAARGYRQINRRALKLLPVGGHLLTCSCSYHVGRRDFQDILQAAAAEARVSLRLIASGRAGQDHPVLLNVPETDYLKALLVQVAAKW